MKQYNEEISELAALPSPPLGLMFMSMAPWQRQQVYGACVLTSFQLAASVERAGTLTENGARRQ